VISFPQGFDTLIPLAVEFFLVATRIGMLLITMPVFSSRAIPMNIQGALLVTTTIAVLGSISDISHVPMDPSGITIALLGEAAVGAAAGLVAQIMLAAIETAGQVLGLPMGLGFAGTVDPATGGSVVITTRFLSLIATMSLLALNVHHLMIALIVRSFAVLPPGEAKISPVSSHRLLMDAALIFDGAIRLAAPVLLVILGVMLTLGLLSRVAPKMNLLALSFAVSIGLGLITLKAALPDMTAWIRDAMLRIEPMAMDVLEGFVR
jgi:flagellar biosynthetic protein FliR